MPLFRVDNDVFFRHLNPSEARRPTPKKHLKTPQKYIKTRRWGAITCDIVIILCNILHNKGGVCKEYYCALKPRSETISLVKARLKLTYKLNMDDRQQSLFHKKLLPPAAAA